MAFAGGFGPDFALVSVNDLLGDVEPEAGAVGVQFGDIFRPSELIKKTL